MPPMASSTSVTSGAAVAVMLEKVLLAGGARIRRVETRSIVVTGMSCEHCANAVRAEVGKLPGVAEVDVDVAAGQVRITGQPLPGDTALRDAVEEAGYEFAG
jgi:copper chaperone